MKSSTRFTLRTVVFDTIAVAIAGAAASQFIFGEPFIWEVPLFFSEGEPIWPMGAMLAGGLVFGSWQSTNWVEPHVSRPLY
ncbi:MAG: hypothetical protein ACRDVK_10740, partial [Acidimicrobiia bacterium]